MLSGGVYFSPPWADFLLLIDGGSSFFSALPPQIYPYKLLLQDKIGPWNLCPSLNSLGSGHRRACIHPYIPRVVWKLNDTTV